MNDFWDFNVNLQITTAIFLIVVLSAYIIFKLLTNKKKLRS